MRKSLYVLWGALIAIMALGPALAQAPVQTQISPPIQAPDGYRLLASPRFDDVAAGIEQLGNAGDERAFAAVQALMAHKLVVQGDTVFIRTESQLIEARTGQAVTRSPAGLHAVRVNNHVRAVLGVVQAELMLYYGTQPQRHMAIAEVMAHPEAKMLPALGRALDDPTNRPLYADLLTAQAAASLSPGAPVLPLAAQLAAIDKISHAGGLQARSILAQSLQSSALMPEARKAAEQAIKSINIRMTIWGYVQNLFYGVSLGSVLLLAAMGLAITFGVMGVINMAHGELMMVGAYTSFVVEGLIGASLPALAPFGLLISLPAAFLITGLLGIAMERGLIRFLYGRPLETLLASWGVSLILQQAIRSLFGPTNVSVPTPAWLSGSLEIGGIHITMVRLAIFCFALIVMAILTVVMRYTSFGLHMRAVTQNRSMAALMGIRTARVDALTFGLGSGIAGLAGVAVSQIDNVSPNLGQGYIIDSFLVVVFGGVGNLWGSLAAALALGVGGKALEPFIGAVSSKIVILVLVILFIQRHPRGMFPMRGRGIES